jgi:Aldehyde oxidase and xanthine dehydrogenase, a/b hammerhead domain
MIGYCSGQKRMQAAVPDVQMSQIPKDIAAGPEYCPAVIKGGDLRAGDLALFMLSPEGQQVFAQFGFVPVGLPTPEPSRIYRCMDGDANLDQLVFSKFAVGQPVPRNEDPMLVRGQGRYTDDLKQPGQAYAVMVRSGYAHDVINGIDTEEASGMPGVPGIYTSPDLTAAGIKNMHLGMAIPTADGSPPHRPSCPVLTSDKVRYVGDPIAIVVAETVAQAKDAHHRIKQLEP